MYFQRFPLVRLAVIFGIGILLGHFNLISEYSFLLFGVLLLSALYIINIWFSLKLNLLFGIGASVLFVLLGAHRLHLAKPTVDPNHLAYLDLKDVLAYEGRIIEVPERKQKSYKLLLQVSQVYTQDLKSAASGKVLLYTDTLIGSGLHLGDIILVSSAPERTEAAKNPFAFDYDKFLERQGVYFQHYEKSVIRLKEQRPNRLKAFAAIARQRAGSFFKTQIDDEQILGIALALILGEKSGLDEEVTNAYAGSGAMHILAVSGLHVGLIYLLFSVFFQRLPYALRRHRWLEALLSVLILFAYALLTGLSPSVMRAVAMFSFVAFGRALKKKVSVYNSLAASAFVLLLIDPFFLFNVGFQLSYSAVIGIVYLQPKIYALLRINSLVLDKIWAITCVSFAAQLATAPFSMYYFHQFPTYFLITNLFAIPAAFLILILGVSALGFSFFGALAQILCWLLTKVIGLTNCLVDWVSGLPYGQMTKITLSVPQLLLLYSLLIFLLLVFTEKKFKMIFPAFLLSLLFGLMTLDRTYSGLQEHEIIVFSLSDQQALMFRKGNKGELWTNKRYDETNDEFTFQVDPYLLYHHMASKSIKVPKARLPFGDLIIFDGLKVLILNEDHSFPDKISKMPWDLVISPELTSMNSAKDFVLTSNLNKANNELGDGVHALSRDGHFSKTW